jgi:hypothetical protein
MDSFSRHFRFLGVGVLSLSACATTPSPSVVDVESRPEPAFEANAASEEPAGKPATNEDVLSFDVNGDKKPDLFRFYEKGKLPTDPSRPETGGPVVRKEVDLNGDGKIDMWTWFAPDGARTKESLDLDYDGKIDETVIYEKNIRVRVEGFTSGRDRADTFKYYEKSKLVRIERDRNNDGQIDCWEYWENETVDRIGEDNDYDGNVDQWVKPQQVQAKKG